MQKKINFKETLNPSIQPSQCRNKCRSATIHTSPSKDRTTIGFCYRQSNNKLPFRKDIKIMLYKYSQFMKYY